MCYTRKYGACCYHTKSLSSAMVVAGTNMHLYAIISNTRQNFCTEERAKQCFKFGLQTTMYMNYIAVRAVGGSYQCAQKHNFRTSAHSDTFTPSPLLRSSYLHFKFIFSSTKCDRLITLYVVIRTCKYLA